MKILYVTATFPFGTGESFLVPELQTLIREGHEVLVVPVRAKIVVVHSDAQKFVGCSMTTGLFSAAVLKNATKEFFGNSKANRKALALLASKQSVGVLAKNLAVVPKSLWLARIARRWGADHIHAYWASAVATTAMLAAESADLPWSFTAHRYDIVERNLLQEKARHASFVRFISESGLKMSGLLAPPVKDKCLVLHVGVEVPAQNPGPQYQGRLIALCPGNLIPVKGHKYLIEAMSELRQREVALDLWIAGQGPLREQLEAYARSLGVSDRVRFTGQLSHNELLELYSSGKVHIFVLPSVDLGGGEHEGIPASLIEAMAYGVPAIATNTGGIPELLSEAVGLIVPPASRTALAEALQTLATHPELRTRLGRAGRKRVESSFDVNDTVQDLLRHIRCSVRNDAISLMQDPAQFSTDCSAKAS